MQNKVIAGSIVGVGMLLAGVLFITQADTPRRAPGDGTTSGTVTKPQEGRAVLENGIQYVDITVRGGYSPRVTKAQAGVPTVIRMKTENTYDCSIALVINDLNYQSYLQPSGVEEIPVPVEKTQGILQGMCSMGMYRFQIEFE